MRSKRFVSFSNIIDAGEYVILDTETSGLDGEVIEIAVIDSSGCVLLNTLVSPSTVCEIAPQATRVHGLTLDGLRDAPNWSVVRNDLRHAINGRPVVIYNADFDVKIIHNTDRNHGLLPSLSYTPYGAFCAMLYIAEYIGEWNDHKGSWRWHTLSNVASRFGIETPNAHRALGDCQTTLAVLQRIQTILQKRISRGSYND